MVVVLILVLLGGWAENARAGGDDDRAQANVRECANRARARHGLPKLRDLKPLDQAASLHAHGMAKRRFFDHIDPQGRGPGERVDLFARRHFDAIGENIAAGFGGSRSTCKAWLRSPSHRANILNPGFSFVGGGLARNGPHATYYVQVFAAK